MKEFLHPLTGRYCELFIRGSGNKLFYILVSLVYCQNLVLGRFSSCVIGRRLGMSCVNLICYKLRFRWKKPFVLDVGLGS